MSSQDEHRRDRKLKVRELADMIGISKSAIHRVLTKKFKIIQAIHQFTYIFIIAMAKINEFKLNCFIMHLIRQI